MSYISREKSYFSEKAFFLWKYGKLLFNASYSWWLLRRNIFYKTPFYFVKFKSNRFLVPQNNLLLIDRTKFCSITHSSLKSNQAKSPSFEQHYSRMFWQLYLFEPFCIYKMLANTLITYCKKVFTVRYWILQYTWEFCKENDDPVMRNAAAEMHAKHNALLKSNKNGRWTRRRV